MVDTSRSHLHAKVVSHKNSKHPLECLSSPSARSKNAPSLVAASWFNEWLQRMVCKVMRVATTDSWSSCWCFFRYILIAEWKTGCATILKRLFGDPPGSNRCLVFTIGMLLFFFFSIHSSFLFSFSHFLSFSAFFTFVIFVLVYCV